MITSTAVFLLAIFGIFVYPVFSYLYYWAEHQMSYSQHPNTKKEYMKYKIIIISLRILLALLISQIIYNLI